MIEETPPFVTAVAVDTTLDLVVAGNSEGDLLAYLLRSGDVLRGWTVPGEGVRGLAILPVQMQLAAVVGTSRLLVLALNASGADVAVSRGGALIAATDVRKLEGGSSSASAAAVAAVPTDADAGSAGRSPTSRPLSKLLSTVYCSRDGRILVVASASALFLVWAHSLELFRTFTPKDGLAICSFCVSEDERAACSTAPWSCSCSHTA